MLINFAQKENPYKEIIDLIHQFPSSTQFFHWLGNEEIVFKVLVEKVHPHMFERVAEYSLDNLRIFSGGGQFKFDWIPESFRNQLLTGEKLFYSLLPEIAKLEKRELSHSIEGYNYTVVSQFYNQEYLCGSCWEIYDLPNLLEVCKMRKIRLAQ